MNPTEEDDFNHIIINRGFDIKDFQILNEPKTTEGIIYDYVNKVTIIRKSNKKEKTYTSQQWLVKFDEDIKNGVFN